MQLRVQERGHDVHVELDGVAGRQDRVLLALSECQSAVRGAEADGTHPAEVSVRARADHMRIQLRGTELRRFDPVAVYRCLRRALVEEQTSDARSGPAVIAV